MLRTRGRIWGFGAEEREGGREVGFVVMGIRCMSMREGGKGKGIEVSEPVGDKSRERD